jgi:hypothetical protein
MVSTGRCETTGEAVLHPDPERMKRVMDYTSPVAATLVAGRLLTTDDLC